MYKIEFVNKGMSTITTYVDQETEYGAKKAVANRSDFDVHVACQKLSPEEAALVRARGKAGPNGQIEYSEVADASAAEAVQPDPRLTNAISIMKLGAQNFSTMVDQPAYQQAYDQLLQFSVEYSQLAEKLKLSQENEAKALSVSSTLYNALNDASSVVDKGDDEDYAYQAELESGAGLLGIQRQSIGVTEEPPR